MPTLVTSTLTSEHWYTNGTFIGIVGLAVSVLAIVITILLWRFGTPRGLLEYSMPVAEAVVGRLPQLSPGDIRVIVGKNVAENPHLVTVRLENNGNRDIRAIDFDQARPLILKLSAPILAVLSASAGSERFFSVKEDAGEIDVPPALIRRGWTLSVTVLTEGRPSLSHDESLADVKVRLRSAETPMWINHGAISSLILILIGTIFVGPGRASGVAVAAGIPLISIGVLTYLFAWLIRLRYSHLKWPRRKYS